MKISDLSPERASSVSSSDAAEVLTAAEAASLLRVNVKSVYDAVKRGEIPGVRRIGRSLRFSRRALVEWPQTSQGRVSRNRSAK